jgi:protein-disulfide isomerase
LVQGIDQAGAVGLALGTASAPVTLTEYSDFSCPHCHEIVPTVHRLIDEYVIVGKLRIVYKPISFVHPPYSVEAAKAAVCAAQQKQGWEMHDQIWLAYEQGGPSLYSQGRFASAARQIGLNEDQFRRCYGSVEAAADVEAVLAEAEAMGINGTPTLFVNGQPVPYTGPDAIYATLKDAINAALENTQTLFPKWISNISGVSHD